MTWDRSRRECNSDKNNKSNMKTRHKPDTSSTVWHIRRRINVVPRWTMSRRARMSWDRSFETRSHTGCPPNVEGPVPMWTSFDQNRYLAHHSLLSTWLNCAIFLSTSKSI
jgi:hypothetical protein